MSAWQLCTVRAGLPISVMKFYSGSPHLCSMPFEPSGSAFPFPSYTTHPWMLLLPRWFLKAGRADRSQPLVTESFAPGPLL